MADATFDLNLMLDDSPAKRRRTKRVLTNEDMQYMKKIEELANERLSFFRKQELREQQVKETKNEITVMTLIKSKRPRPTSRSTTSTGKKEVHKKKKVPPPKAVRIPQVINETTKQLNEFIVNEMKGTNIKLVIQKALYNSDTQKGLNRLNMPKNQLSNDEFLTVDERRILNDTDPEENAIEVRLLGPTLEMYKEPMKMKMWRMTSTVNYVLTTNWYQFWKENKEHLPENGMIQVWSFRRDEQLCFGVVCVKEPDRKDSEDKDD